MVCLCLLSSVLLAGFQVGFQQSSGQKNSSKRWAIPVVAIAIAFALLVVGTRTAILPFAPTLTADLVIDAAPYFAVAMMAAVGYLLLKKVREPIIHFSVALAWRPPGFSSFFRLWSSSRLWISLQALYISFHAAWSVRRFCLDKIRQWRQ